ncbi:MAG: radical SAM protein [Candidatus Pacearchaeota archaeon]
MVENVDVIFVNPGNRLSQFGNLSEYATVAQPLGIAMIASFVREEGFNPKIIDAEVKEWKPDRTVEEILKYNPLFVGLTTFTTKMTAAGEILRLLKEKAPEIKTCIGGHHASAIPERTLNEEKVDFLIKGEGYYPTLNMLKLLKKNPYSKDYPVKGVWYKKNGKIISNPDEELISLEKLPLAAWDLLPMNEYRAHHWQCWEGRKKNSFALIFSSLGCPFRCDFCSVNVVYGKRIARCMSPKMFVRQIDNLIENYNIENYEIIDDTFTLNKDRVIKICDLLTEKKRDLNMWCFARTDRVDPTMLLKMKKAGINWVFLGIEAGNELTLSNVLKKQNIKQIRNAVNRIRDAKIYVGGNYVFGLPGDTMDSMQDTLDLAIDLNCEWSNFFVPMAYPGTALYNNALGKGILPRKWEQYGFFAPNSVPLPTEKLTSQQIIKFRDKAFEVFFSGEKYQKMIREKFGDEVLDYIKKMLEKKIERVENPELEVYEEVKQYLKNNENDCFC